MAIRTIVVALAFEEDSQQVVDRAVSLANEHEAQLIGVHVLENVSLHRTGLPSTVDPDTLAALISDENAERLGEMLKASKRPALTRAESGKPHAVIEAIAASHDADLIVIGLGVAENLREKVFGSTADRIVRCAPCPVLVVRNPGDAAYRHITVGVDFSEPAKVAAMFAARLAPSARREFIHAIEIPLAFEQAMLKAGTSQQEIAHYRSEKARAARQQVLDAFGEDGDLATSARLNVVQGDPAAALLSASRRQGTDLVALGTQGANAVTQHLLGSVARKVLAGSRCDVLVVPASALI